MNEYWHSEDGSSFCFCCDGEWFQMVSGDSDDPQWNFCTVTMLQGLPEDMQERNYEEIDLHSMLDELEWSEDELQSQIKSQLNPTD